MKIPKIVWGGKSQFFYASVGPYLAAHIYTIKGYGFRVKYFGIGREERYFTHCFNTLDQAKQFVEQKFAKFYKALHKEK